MASLDALNARSLGLASPVSFRLSCLQQESLIGRLGRQRVLDGHHGCVNCVTFASGGNLLLSGSDDLHVCIWQPQTGARLLRYDSGHR